jgi:hypothetical protein
MNCARLLGATQYFHRNRAVGSAGSSAGSARELHAALLFTRARDGFFQIF